MKESLRRPWLLVLTIGLGTLLNPLNSSMISIAVTNLQKEFSLTFADASWLISIFYLASAAAQPITGKLSDMFGPKRLFLTGLTLVAFASFLAVFSPNYPFLLACRALQAIGSSTLFPSGMAMIRSSITKRQGRALAAISIFSTTSAAFGPSIAGFLMASWDWPSIFIVNFPFVLISFSLAIFILPNTGKSKFDWKRIDFLGMLLFIVSMTNLIIFLLSLAETINYWALIVFFATTFLFCLYEKKKQEPFIDISALQKNHQVTFVYLQFISINLVYYCYFFGLPAFLQQNRLYSEQETGLIMLALSGFSVLIAPLTGRLVDLHGPKFPLMMGAASLTTGTALLLSYQDSSSLLWLLFIMAIIGMSVGFNNISMQRALFDSVRREDTGAASGLFQTCRYLGSILSSSLLGIAFTQNIDVAHLHIVAMVCLLFCGLVLVLTFLRPGPIHPWKT